MNRIILLGNGFDLAHNMRTSYNDFIISYLIDAHEKAFKQGTYEDAIVSISKFPNINNIEIGSVKSIDELIQHHYKNNFAEMSSGMMRIPGYSNSRTNPFSFRYKSDFFKNLVNQCSLSSWVEIENEYYIWLKKGIDLEKDKKVEYLRDLNEAFKFIIEQLQIHLTRIKPEGLEDEYLRIITASIPKEEILTNKRFKGIARPNKTQVLNFNYTSTIERYLDKIQHPTCTTSINYIHGKLNSPTNPLIFGFGDELDRDYEKMELESTRGFFQFIKSFGYFKTSNYHNLIRFLENGDYQVFILGHSCGLSDRTMLNMIFEHENCRSIKIFYHENSPGQNNFRDLTEEISRHFKNKADMRKKIVPFDKSEKMPQLKR